MAATIKDIANRTGLGLATISSYLNGGNVREKNREKIEAAIKELNFEVNEVARGLKTNRTYTIGVVIPELNNIFCTEIITAMEDILRKKGYATIVCDCRTDKQLEREAVEFLYRKRVDGIINMPVDSSGAHLKQFADAKKPMIIIDRKLPELSCDSILVDNQDAAKKAVDILLENGHEKIAMVTGPKEIYTAHERYKGYEAALNQAGIKVDSKLVVHSDYTIRGAVAGVTELLEHHPEVTAVFAANYEMTMGTMIALNEKGIRIPKDLSVIGFDNREFARALHPTLTIITQPTEAIARHAAELMLKKLESDETTTPTEIYLETEVMHGKSVQNMGVSRA
ncbi:MAG: LacI family DNA-binding transcriptional regulator [Eubacterium sp.]|nr:LacI family DNA-binding transcriptional regulator [Eubacterium sp.]